MGSMRNGDDGQAKTMEEIESFFNYNPPELSMNSNLPKKDHSFQRPDPFYDKHVDKNHILMRIQRVPSLLEAFGRAATQTVQAIKDKSLRLPVAGFRSGFPTVPYRAAANFINRMDASSIALRYGITVESWAMTVAATLTLHPEALKWYGVHHFRQIEHGYFPHQGVEEDFAPCLDYHEEREMDEPFWNSVSDDTKTKILQMTKSYPALGFWQFFPPDVKHILEAMDEVVVEGDFQHQRCNALAPLGGNSLPLSPDSSFMPWGTPVTAFLGQTNPTERPRRSERIEAQKDNHGARRSRSDNKAQVQCWQTVEVLPRHRSRSSSDTIESAKVIASALLQRAWSEAVRRDSTVIVFNCGNYERVGIRHRGSQTLFLSDMYDVTTCKNPAYGQLHVGIHISILQDVLERISKQEMATPSVELPSRKRRATSSLKQVVKRPRTRAYDEKERREREERSKTYQIVSGEASQRDFAILNMRYQKFNSVVPLALLRTHPSLVKPLRKGWKRPSLRKKYRPDQYFLITLTSTIACGATGVAHKGLLRTRAPGQDPSKGAIPIVVKFSFLPKQKERIKHEYSIYKHLVSAKVKGIPCIHGLFEDVESGALALVMDDVGDCLVSHTVDGNPFKYNVSKSQQEGFLRIVKDIHRAGVRHRDLRRENLALNDEGEPFIIDFDRAKIDDLENARNRELEVLSMVFASGWAPYQWTTGKSYTPSRDGDPERSP